MLAKAGFTIISPTRAYSFSSFSFGGKTNWTIYSRMTKVWESWQ